MGLMKPNGLKLKIFKFYGRLTLKTYLFFLQSYMNVLGKNLDPSFFGQTVPKMAQNKVL